MTDLSPFSPPRISAAQFARVLRGYGAPDAAQREGEACYAAIVTAGVCPAVALGFALKEHSLRWLGVSARTKGWGNVTIKALRGNTTRVRHVGADGRFAVYACYADGAADWAEYLYYRYHQHGIVDLGAILRIYAPTSDNNDPEGYAATIRRLVPAWVAADATRRQGRVVFDGARVRQAPRLDAPVVMTLRAGAAVVIDHIIADGAPVVDGDGATSTRWARITAPCVGYMAAYLIREG